MRQRDQKVEIERQICGPIRLAALEPDICRIRVSRVRSHDSLGRTTLLHSVPGTAPRDLTCNMRDERLHKYLPMPDDYPSCVAAGSLLQARFIGGVRFW